MRTRSVKRAAAPLAVLALMVAGSLAETTQAAAAPVPQPPRPRFGVGTIRYGVSSAGVPADQWTDAPRINANGRYALFSTAATNVVPGDTNGVFDVFLRDLWAGVTIRVSVSGTGAQGNGASSGGAISTDGRYVAFVSTATNLVPGDTNGTADIFVRDRQTGATTRVNVTSSGQQANGFSNITDISGDGRYVMFGTNATNLVPGGDANGAGSDDLVHDRQTGQTILVDVATNGVQASMYSSGAAISRDGRYALFSSLAPNLVPGDTNGVYDVFVRDLVAGTTVRVSKPNAGLGTQGDQDSYARGISPDGRYIAFDSVASNLVASDTNNTGDAFVLDRSTGTATRVSLADAGGESPYYNFGAAISADGRYAAFVSADGDLVPGDTNQQPDIFVRDLRAGTTRRINVSNTGVQADRQSVNPRMTDDGLNVVYMSEATTLVPGDTNDSFDVFLHRRARE
jgi:Tol biopolymer transport system component